MTTRGAWIKVRERDRKGGLSIQVSKLDSEGILLLVQEIGTFGEDN